MSISESGSTLEYTEITSIPKKVAILRSSFRAGKLADVDFRLSQLRNLYFGIKDNEDIIKKSILKDLNKPAAEFQLQELNTFYSDLISTIDNLRKWVKPRHPDNIPLLFKFSSAKVIPTPLGVVLVIGAYNFPLMLSLLPVIAAIAAGNPVVLKQSELVPYTTQTITDILIDTLDPQVLQVVNGGIYETTAVLNEKFDKIFYTGNGIVGKIIAKKAAETLTPVVLELGGKSPVFVTEHAGDLDITAKRIVLSKFTNAGQVCVAPDYTVVHESVYDEFVSLVVKWTKKQYEENFDEETYNKIVHERAIDRLTKVVSETKGEIVYQYGQINKDKRYFPLTIIKDVQFGDSTMKDELFGPILPIIKYSSLEDTIEGIDTSSTLETPLALYIFSTDTKEQNRIISRVRSGAVLINETLIHAGVSALPFGGVGNSGYGNYHGIYGFDTFSHMRAYMKQPFWVEPLFDAKYPPVKPFDLKLATFFMVPKVWFGRQGKVSNSFFYWVFASLVVGFGMFGFLFGFFFGN